MPKNPKPKMQYGQSVRKSLRIQARVDGKRKQESKATDTLMKADLLPIISELDDEMHEKENNTPKAKPPLVNAKVAVQQLYKNPDLLKNLKKRYSKARNQQYNRLAACETPLSKRKRVICRATQLNVLRESEYTDVLPFERRLQYVVALVDVRRFHINFTSEVQKLMKAMGAKIVKSIGDSITHIVFQEGSDDTFVWGRKNGCHLVSVEWLYNVKRYSTRVPEMLYDALESCTGSRKILEVCQIDPDLIMKINTESIPFDIKCTGKKYLKVPQHPSNYKLQLVNGVVTKVKMHQNIANVEDNTSGPRELFCDTDKTAVLNYNVSNQDVKSLSIEPIDSQYCIHKILSLPASMELEIANTPSVESLEHRSSSKMVSYMSHNLTKAMNQLVSLSKRDNTKENPVSGTSSTVVKPSALLPRNPQLYSSANIPSTPILKSSRHYSSMNTPSTPVSQDPPLHKAVNTLPKPFPLKRQLYSPMNKSQNWNNLELVEAIAKQRKIKIPRKQTSTITKPEVSKECNERQSISANVAENIAQCSLSHAGLSLHPTKMPEIVTYDETIRYEIQSIVCKLGSFDTNQKVTHDTTHLILGKTEVLTINVLKGIAKGCWILKFSWLTESRRSGKWLPEEDFELKHLCPAVMENRVRRQTFGVHSLKLFDSSKLFYLPDMCPKMKKHLFEIIVLSGGRITTKLASAWVAIDYFKECDIPCVSKHWVYNCVKLNIVLPFGRFLVKPVSLNY